MKSPWANWWRDYLPANHRLLEADGLRKEDADTGEVEFYTVSELRSILNNATEELRVIIALQAFGGLTETALRGGHGVWRLSLSRRALTSFVAEKPFRR